MQIKAYKTSKIVPGDNLYKILDQYLPVLKEKSIVVITSKIISICQGRVVKNDGKVDKKDLIKKEADLYFENEELYKYGTVILTVKNDIFIANSGIDESNGDDYFILWPENLQETTNKIWEYLCKKNKIKNLGIIVTDSRIVPLRRGTLGIGICHCGFEALKNYIDKPDIFGRHLKMTYANLLDGLSAGAVLTMGEGDEQTPLALISDTPFISFQNRFPTGEEIKDLQISIKEDLYSPVLTAIEWKKGGK